MLPLHQRRIVLPRECPAGVEPASPDWKSGAFAARPRAQKKPDVLQHRAHGVNQAKHGLQTQDAGIVRTRTRAITPRSSSDQGLGIAACATNATNATQDVLSHLHSPDPRTRLLAINNMPLTIIMAVSGKGPTNNGGKNTFPPRIGSAASIRWNVDFQSAMEICSSRLLRRDFRRQVRSIIAGSSHPANVLGQSP